ncbi:MAG: glycosyltransferase family 4 protein [Betaproteobacteria bacterium]|nr:glycosyltransferase family 4 protein [Betaproteobacteria bacterium]MSQ87915.1 glycosyltransferase family 4 protein [Betaproteobacteria bacterium]
MPAALVAILVSFVISLACLWVLLSPFGRRRMLDRPNHRSLHEQPVPRSGGLAIVAGVAAGMTAGIATGSATVVTFPFALALTLGMAGALAALSLADDLFTLPTLLRLVVHLAAAGVVVSLVLGVADPLLLVVLVLAVAWYANLYNFMDGSDGLAGGMAAFGFGAYAFAAYQSGDVALATASGSIAVATLAFLRVNFHPARLFMGDVGSVPLGFLAGALGVLGWHDGLWPLWFPVLVFAPFVCDATLTLVKRLLRRERLWQAHQDHYYQRLVRLGFGHRGAAWIEYAAMAGCVALALFVRRAEGTIQIGALCTAAMALIAIAVWIDWRWRRAGRDPGKAAA